MRLFVPPGQYYAGELILFEILLGRNRVPPRISLEAAGVTKDIFVCILCLSDFPRNPTIMKINFPSVSHDSFRRNSRQSVRNRCPVMFQPSVYYICTVFHAKNEKPRLANRAMYPRKKSCVAHGHGLHGAQKGHEQGSHFINK